MAGNGGACACPGAVDHQGRSRRHHARPIPAPSNTLAALTAITFGFGLGHSFQERWGEDGAFFTLTQSLSAAAVLTGAVISVDLDEDRRDLGHKIML